MNAHAELPVARGVEATTVCLSHGWMAPVDLTVDLSTRFVPSHAGTNVSFARLLKQHWGC